MDEDTRSSRIKRWLFIAVALCVLIALGAFLFITLRHNLELAQKLQTTENQLTSTSEKASDLNQRLSSTTGVLEQTQEDNRLLSEALQNEQDRNREFEDQIDSLSGTIGKLDKLSKTDRELLQKYSKVYFLNENYIPERLVQIDTEYVYDDTDDEYVHAKAAPFLEDMLDAALDDDVKIWVVSGFRSFDEQADLKGNYLVNYGTGANTFSADQGYSEHQLGTTFDFTTEGIGGGLNGFENTEAYTWLQKNAYKYGFILSYPTDNTYYVFEPWHWRFVGTKLADDLHDKRKNFYDLDQRDIDEYLISIFD